MVAIGIPVPPGFTITTEVWLSSTAIRAVCSFKDQVKENIARLEETMGAVWRQREPSWCLLGLVPESPCSMMDTVLNLGLNDVTVGRTKKSINPRFVGLTVVLSDVRRRCHGS